MTSLPPASLRLAVIQTAPVLRDVAGNARSIAQHVRSAGADVALTPELSLTGYDLGDAVHDLARDFGRGRTFGQQELADLPGFVIVGGVEAAPRGPFNAAAVLRGGRVHFRHRKLYLPTYGMFDEGRWFGSGSVLDVWTTPHGWRIGVLICEDFWHPGLIYALASRGLDALLVQAAAPGRGVWEAGEHSRFASADVWERLVRTTAQLYGIYVALCNRTGVEGAITFAGGSLVAGPDGRVLARAPDAGEDVLLVEMSRESLRSGQRPYHHARDDDVRFVVRELRRGLRDAS